MVVKNYTTSILVEKTIMEIEQLLCKFGAQAIMKEYLGGQVSSLSFFVLFDDQKIPFKLPLKTEKARSIISNAVNEGYLPQRYLNEPLRTEQGLRVGWRIIKDWIHSNLSLLEIEFANPVEIFLPYMHDYVEGKTLYDKFIENKSKFIALEETKSPSESN